MREFTPEITELKPNEVFVFGSNMAGNHAGGAARTAVEKFGAIMGQAEGPQGQSYAIPTLNCNMAKVTEEQLQASLEKFAKYAADNDNLKFYLTKIGCGIAGFSEEEIAEVIYRVHLPHNVVIPQEFAFLKGTVLGYKGFKGDLTCRGKKYEIGEVFSEDEASLCAKGLHFCENPHDVFGYYPAGEGNRFCRVEANDTSVQKDNDSKRAAKRLRINAEISVFEICKIAVSAFFENFGFKKKIEAADTTNAGDYGAANAGYRGAANAGDYGAAIVLTGGKVKGGYGCVLVARDFNWVNERFEVVDWAAAIVDGVTIKADTWYRLKDGKFVECDEQ